MKNKKGFTLIELLAVIVILAVLMVIAVPKILDVIENSRKSAAKSSAELYIDAVKKYIAINEVNNKGINVPDDNDLTMGNADDDIELSKIKIKGDSPDYVTITFENSKIKEAGFCINNYNVEYKNGNVKISETDYCKFATVESVYINNKISILEVGEEYQLEVMIEPSDIVPLYTSSNANVAEVSSTGLITAKSPGKTNIIVKAGQKSAIFELEVIKGANEALIGYIEKTNFTNDTIEQVTIEDVTYSLHVYNFDGDQTWSSNPSFGSESDVATASTYAQNMVVVKVNGDLTIDSGVTVTPYASASGYGGPKGFLLYVKGAITNNGKISMTARGAKAVGQNVYLWKNADGNYEYVPAKGANGAGSSDSKNGANGSNATTVRATGGGGKGSGYYNSYKAFGGGGSGTSYSGGPGGGGTVGNAYEVDNTFGNSNGGAGGSGAGTGVNLGKYGPSGAGNPAGTSVGVYSGVAQNGTGGLLIMYADNIINTGTIESNGSKGGTATQYVGNGAGSGGGSINIFYNTSYNNIGNIYVNGGSGGTNTKAGVGGSGGKGSITTCSIATGSCVID